MMSVAVFVVLQQEIPDFDPFVNGKVLAHRMGQLDAECEDLGVELLGNFVSMEKEELVAILRRDGLEELVPHAEEQWFEPGRCVATLDALEKAVPELRHFERDLDGLLEDLSGIRAVLTRAAEAGVKFHLQYDY